MVEFWQTWWLRVEWLSLVASVLWGLWMLAVLPASVILSTPDHVTSSERRWLRILGWASVISGPARPKAYGRGAAWKRYCAQYETTFRTAERAHRARFAIPVLLAEVSVAAALAQLALTLVCLIPYSTIWFPISFALAVFGCAPFFVTMSLRNRRWRNRQPFEWSFFEQMLWVQNASKDGPLAADARRTDALDLVERHLIERFARTPLDLPSQSARARRWQSASLAVIAQRPLLEDPATAVEDSQKWFERCIELVLPPRKKSRHRGASFGEGQLPKPLPKLKQETALQAPWAIVVLYTNVLMLLSVTFAEDIGAEVRDLIAAPITADITSTMNEVITSLTGLAALVAAVISIVRGSRRSIVR